MPSGLKMTQRLTQSRPLLSSMQYPHYFYRFIQDQVDHEVIRCGDDFMSTRNSPLLYSLGR